jgi:2-keto-4-pentenoate hydratase
MTDIEEAVELLVGARNRGTPRPAPALADAAAAYAVQARVAETFGWFVDGPARHWKSGGPSREAVLAHAPLPPAGVMRSPADAGRWPFRLRGIEAEIALRLGQPVDRERAASLDVNAARALVESMCVSIEIVDTRWAEGLQAPALAKLADLQAHGALVLGEWRPFAALDWAAQTCRVRIGNQPPREFRGSHSLGDPAWGLGAWLRHATRDGATLPAGSVVTTGTWCGIVQASAGERVEVEFDGIGQAHVQL